ncbi:MAG: hypothetical protein GQ547_03170 [Methylophaga sp.]|nr:hypothetical protein [Methylophaga sp.]
MQINGAHLATAFAPKPITLQEQVRKPVTIDAISSFKLEDKPSPQEKVNTPASQAAITVNDGQQARFIRFFSTSDEVSSPTQKESASPRPLPQGVQQYLQVSNLQNQPAQTYLDEIV